MIPIINSVSKRIEEALKENAKVSSEACTSIQKSNGTLPKQLLPKQPKK